MLKFLERKLSGRKIKTFRPSICMETPREFLEVFIDDVSSGRVEKRGPYKLSLSGQGHEYDSSAARPRSSSLSGTRKHRHRAAVSSAATGPAAVRTVAE